VRHGVEPSWEALQEVIFNAAYCDLQGNRYPILHGLQDAMGHKTKEVYEWCWKNSPIRPCKGKDDMAANFTLSKIQAYPSMQLTTVNTRYFKDSLDTKLKLPFGSVGGFTLHAGADEAYAREMCAEARNEKGIWEQIGSRPNHWWDCEVYCHCAAEQLGLQFRRPEPEPQKSKTEQKHSPLAGRRLNPYRNMS